MNNESNEHDAPTANDREAAPMRGPILIAPLSTLSLVFGVASFLLLFLVIPAIATAIAAIFFGHIALRQIRNLSNEVLGSGRANAGLLLGYGTLLVALIMSFFLDEGRLFVRGILASDRTAAAVNPASFSDGPLGEIERELFRRDDKPRGNTEEANDLAGAARRQIKVYLRDSLQLEGQKGFDWDVSGVDCYCRVESGALFVVYVPGVEGFNDAAIEILNRASWLSVAQAVRDSGAVEKGFPIALCIMGKRRCQTFFKGVSVSVDEALNDPDFSGNEQEAILPFFE